VTSITGRGPFVVRTGADSIDARAVVLAVRHL